jgi:hypothetical protein
MVVRIVRLSLPFSVFSVQFSVKSTGCPAVFSVSAPAGRELNTEN